MPRRAERLVALDLWGALFYVPELERSVLIFHIGMPKTATTFLQYRIFKKNLPKSFYHWKAEKRVMDIMELSQGLSENDGEKFTLVKRWLEDIGSDDISILSCENISSKAPAFWSGEGPSPLEVTERLVRLAEASGIDRHNVKIILGVRRQDQMLASRYSQGAASKEGYSQAGFEETISYILEKGAVMPGYRWLYFDICKREIESLIGSDNLFIYHSEKLSLYPESVIKEMGEFCEVDFMKALRNAEKNESLNSVNKKSIAPDRWSLGSSEEKLVLNESLKRKILEHFSESNNRFNEAVG